MENPDLTLELSTEEMRQLMAQAMEHVLAHVSSLPRQPSVEIEGSVELARTLAWRVASVQSKGDVPGPEAPALKVFSSELFQRIGQVGMQMMSLYGQLEPGSKWAPLMGAIERLYLVTVSRTIAAGTSEIQRNIIAERGLGLPR